MESIDITNRNRLKGRIHALLLALSASGSDKERISFSGRATIVHLSSLAEKDRDARVSERWRPETFISQAVSCRLKPSSAIGRHIFKCKESQRDLLFKSGMMTGFHPRQPRWELDALAAVWLSSRSPVVPPQRSISSSCSILHPFSKLPLQTPPTGRCPFLYGLP